MKYKVGDKVRIKSLDWYNENKDEYGVVLVENGEYMFRDTDTEWCSRIVTIRSVHLSEYYRIKEDGGKYRWTNDMIEGLVEDESSIDLTVKGEEVKERIEITIPEGYEYVIESGKIIFTKKKKEYPKDYDECCNVLGDDDKMSLGMMNELRKLVNARNAYWKIYGEANGLGGSWKPDYKKERYVIHRHIDEIVRGYRQADLMEHFILEFPTEELRDMFYERFKSEIELCKEFL